MIFYVSGIWTIDILFVDKKLYQSNNLKLKQKKKKKKQKWQGKRKEKPNFEPRFHCYLSKSCHMNGLGLWTWIHYSNQHLSVVFVWLVVCLKRIHTKTTFFFFLRNKYTHIHKEEGKEFQYKCTLETPLTNKMILIANTFIIKNMGQFRKGWERRERGSACAAKKHKVNLLLKT